MKTFDVYWYTKESRIIRVKAKNEMQALKLVEQEGEDAGKLLDHNSEVDSPEVMEVSNEED